MNIVATANYFKDNTDYGSPATILDNIGSNKSITNALDMKKFNLSNNGNLQVVLSVTNLSQEIMHVISQYPNELRLENENELHIDTTLDVSGPKARNKKNDGISFSIPGSFDPDGQVIQRTYGISIDRRNTTDANSDPKKDRYDIL